MQPRPRPVSMPVRLSLVCVTVTPLCVMQSPCLVISAWSVNMANSFCIGTESIMEMPISADSHVPADAPLDTGQVSRDPL